MKPLISIIIPVYNVEQYLHRCVDSVLNQTYKNLEIILVNDGSPDNCPFICDEYAKKDKRIIVVHKENGGLSSARNAGLEIVQGEYISFIDSDDWIHENYIEILYKNLHEKKADISICNFLEIADEEDPIINISNKLRIFNNIEALHELYGALYIQFVVSWAKLFKKYLFEELRFPNGKVHEDEFTSYKLLYNAKKIVYSNDQLYYYYQSKDSITRSGFKLKNKLDVLEAYEEQALYFEKNHNKEFSLKAYKRLFEIYNSIKENLHLIKDEQEKILFSKNYKKFIIQFKKLKFGKKYTIYYKSYLFSPFLAKTIKKIYSLKNITNR